MAMVEIRITTKFWRPKPTIKCIYSQVSLKNISPWTEPLTHLFLMHPFSTLENVTEILETYKPTSKCIYSQVSLKNISLWTKPLTHLFLMHPFRG